MHSFEQNWSDALARRAEEGVLRSLSLRNTAVDFCSNDYLGLASDKGFQQQLLRAVSDNPRCLAGATGSRLISGHSLITEQTEIFIAGRYGVEAALLFPSGYKANLALFSAIAGRQDTIIVDQRIHRSVHDGCRLSPAVKWKFGHNDTAHLEALLKKAGGQVFIAIESLYSMEGDFAPLNTVAELAAHYRAGLIVDEAHATGVFGNGLVDQAGLQQQVLATLVTYGKAMGVQGAAVLGTGLLKEYLVNFASPFIYSTAMPDVQAISIRAAYNCLDQLPERAAILSERIRHFREYGLPCSSMAGSPVQVIPFADGSRLRALVRELEQSGIGAYAVFPPTADTARLRVCIHAGHSPAEIDLLCTIIKKYVHE